MLWAPAETRNNNTPWIRLNIPFKLDQKTTMRMSTLNMTFLLEISLETAFSTIHVEEQQRDRTHDQVHMNTNTLSQRSDFFELPSFVGNKKTIIALDFQSWNHSEYFQTYGICRYRVIVSVFGTLVQQFHKNCWHINFYFLFFMKVMLFWLINYHSMCSEC